MKQSADSGIVSPNFWFLEQHDPALLQAAVSAERYVFSDPNSALVKLRQLAEFFARGVAARLGLPSGEFDNFAEVERQLRDAGQLDDQLGQVMRTVRRLGNDAAHSLDGERRDALHSLKLVRQLAIWFHKTTRRDTNFRAGPFVPPATPSDADAPLQEELQTLRDRLAEREEELRQVADVQLPELKQRLNEAFSTATAAQQNEQAAIELAVESEEAAQARIVALEKQLRELAAEATQAAPPERKAVAEAAQRAAQQIELDESDTRKLIDEQLVEAGWEPAQLAEWFRANTAATSILAQVQEHPTHYIVSDHPDELRRVERGYGTGVRPTDYLDAFRAYVREHLNDLPALLVVTQRPRDLTRSQLKELRLALDLAGFSEANLQTAWRETTNQDIAASIVGYIRHVACDQPLVAHSERVQSAMRQILASRSWTDPQRRWLERIGKQLEQEFVVDREALDSGQFRQMGGFTRLNKIFKGELETILKTIAEAMWQAA